MGRQDQYMNDGNDVESRMQTNLQMQMADDIRAMRMGTDRMPLVTGRSSGHATSGWKNRGLFFWIVLIIATYWFILRPLGL